MRHRLFASQLFALLSCTFALVGCGSDDGAAAAGASAGGGGGADAGAGGSTTGGRGSGSGGLVGQGEFSDRTSTELFASLSIGWNLGNSLDAPDGETSWNNPLVSAALLQAVADSGFQVVRIPVTWSKHMGAGPDYAIDAAFLTRVEEVVQQAIDSGLYAIINLHHDGADALAGVEWLTLNDAQGAVTEDNNAAVEARFVAVWTQIAERFQGFGEHLLFESMNEIHDGYGAPDPQYYEIINNLNQTFVDTVRSSGGNNAQRHLIVPGYNTNIDFTLAGFDLPLDSTPERLSLSVHFYDPWNFAGAGMTHTWGAAAPGHDTYGQEDFVVAQFDKLAATYVNSGIPVVMGEYGAVHQAGYEEYRRYYLEYVTKAAVDRGIVPVYWDNGGLGATEGFGLFDRSSNTAAHPTLVEAILRAATSDYALADVAPAAP